MRRALALCLSLSLAATLASAQSDIIGTRRIEGMEFPARVTRDSNGIINILAFNRHDLYFLNGYAHAHDRLFQMDVSRRTASGTLAELVGQAAIAQDVQLRTLGLRRAAEASLPIYSERARGVLEAYAAGVNAYLRDNPALPSEYQALEITQIAPWTPVDSIAIGKLIAFSLSFELEDIDATIALRTYQQVGQAAGFNGTALFFEDLFRSAPFDKASTVPDATAASDFEFEAAAKSEPEYLQSMENAVAHIHPSTIELGRRYLAELDSIGFFERFRIADLMPGSNEWGIHGSRSGSGRPMIANDPHLSLSTPSTFYPIVLRAGRISVAGHGFAGIPGIILGHNNRIAWGATTVGFDVTDVYQEQIVPVQQAPAGLGVMINGQTEWLFPIVQVFRRNVTGDGTNDNLAVVPAGGSIPPATLIVSRRNAPIVQLNAATGIGISVQYTGLHATRELETFLIWAEAEDLEDFKAGLQRFDFGAQNWAYVDVDGNIGHFTSGEIPLREDLEAGQVNGAPPSFIRNGAGGNEWLREFSPSGDQSVPYKILPFDQMPQVVNPSRGWFVNANNDPAGTTLDNNPLNETRPGGGILYLARWYANGLRAGRITQMIRNELHDNGKVTFDEMKAMQADVVMLDAQFFVPYIIQAFRNAQAGSAPPPLAAFAVNPLIASAVARLEHWDFSAPTGIPEGYDAVDQNGNLSAPSQQEIDHSVAATIYSVWRGRFIANTIDPVIATFNAQVPSGFPGPDQGLVLAALRNLLENFGTRAGAGASGINFFNVPQVPNNAETAPLRRDLLILRSLADALGLLASDTFKAAFNNSSNQDDFRWGRLHRVVFAHPLGSPFSVPPAGGAFLHPLGADLPGIPTDGGYEVVDASGHNIRAATPAQFMFGGGPARRFVAEGRTDGINAETSLPGGPSGRLGSPLYFNLLKPWLTNEYYPSVLLRGINIPFLRD